MLVLIRAHRVNLYGSKNATVTDSAGLMISSDQTFIQYIRENSNILMHGCLFSFILGLECPIYAKDTFTYLCCNAFHFFMGSTRRLHLCDSW